MAKRRGGVKRWALFVLALPIALYCGMMLQSFRIGRINSAEPQETAQLKEKWKEKLRGNSAMYEKQLAAMAEELNKLKQVITTHKVPIEAAATKNGRPPATASSLVDVSSTRPVPPSARTPTLPPSLVLPTLAAPVAVPSSTARSAAVPQPARTPTPPPSPILAAQAPPVAATSSIAGSSVVFKTIAMAEVVGRDFSCPRQGTVEGSGGGVCRENCHGRGCENAVAKCKKMQGCVGIDMNVERTVATLKKALKWGRCQ